MIQQRRGSEETMMDATLFTANDDDIPIGLGHNRHYLLSHASSYSEGYSDADLAKDLNAMRAEDRNAMEEDIHGVSPIIDETEDFVAVKIQQLNAHIDVISPREREAWDRAVFLRPSLEHDKSLRLLCLRARQFRPFEAAKALINMFEDKLRLFGDALLVQRITWNDLTSQEHEIIRSGIYQLIPSLETRGRGIAFVRLSQWDTRHNHKAYARCLHYMQSAILDDEDMQKCGVVSVIDYGGRWKSTPLDIMHFLSSLPEHMTSSSCYFHQACTHALYEDKKVETLVQFFRRILPKDQKLRYRLHQGSAVDNEYSLHSFGIDFSGMLGGSVRTTTNDDGPLSMQLLDEDIQKRQDLDDQWRQTERPYRNPSSPVALVPNPQDVIMGRNKKIAMSWPGNAIYHQAIGRYTERYMAAQTGDRIHLTLICMEILHIVQRQHRGRFLLRGVDDSSSWQVCEDAAVLKKIGQALRTSGRQAKAAQSISLQKKKKKKPSSSSSPQITPTLQPASSPTPL